MADSAMEVDDIDAESLQAQIDMSMSLVQSLVSSWVKPSKKSTKANDLQTEKELEELMRRPPRLGVGASIPETSVAFRDAARLKNHLMSGKKRTRDQSLDDTKPAQLSDDEEDSRASVVRKKSKPDPFAGGKKKSSQLHGLMTPGDTPARSQTQSIEMTAPTAMIIDQPDVAPTHAATPSPRKKKKKKKKTDQAGTTNIAPLSPPLTPSSHDIQRKTNVSESITEAANSAIASPTKETSLGVSVSTPKPSTPTRVRPLPNTSVAFSIPLLNLDGPPPAAGGPGAHTASPGESTKKKRKRPKKKKNRSATSDAAANKVVHTS